MLTSSRRWSSQAAVRRHGCSLAARHVAGNGDLLRLSLEMLPRPNHALIRGHSERSLRLASFVMKADSIPRLAIRLGLWRDQRGRTVGHDHLALVEVWFTNGFDTADLKDTEALLDELSLPLRLQGGYRSYDDSWHRPAQRRPSPERPLRPESRH